MTFTLPIRFQQVPDPVPAKFTLSAKFFLMSQKDEWLHRVKMGDFKVDAAFSKGKTLKRRISNRLPLVFKAYGCFIAPNPPPLNSIFGVGSSVVEKPKELTNKILANLI